MKKLLILAMGILLPLAAASAASAQSYPPATVAGAVAGADANNDPGATSASTPLAAPLARTGVDLAPYVEIGLGLIAVGGAVLYASRRRRLTA